MPSLLVQSCSKSKQQPGESVPALELYSGFFFKIIKKAKREGAFNDGIDLCILSAEHGLIDSDADIDWYDRRMDADRARYLAPSVKSDLRERAANGYDDVIVNAGKDYHQTIDDISPDFPTTVYTIDGTGIGDKGNTLKRLVRGQTTPAACDDIIQILP
ncbi:DUF6884 domain-containing protein [Haloarchaeobius litoreus]|uniref:DUF6884 domain-containing protein n=1 Tax=Haloarchaeobius litoreus TaxID=755306 RepID=A0ABD6DLC3_9EURY|nr:DUF6884 domain-containing protein [Haloarchaeobius litoreus]